MVLINIQEKQIIRTAYKVEIQCINIDLNASATINVKFYDNNEAMIHSEFFALVKPDYAGWTNDEWLINYVLEKYELIDLSI